MSRFLVEFWPAFIPLSLYILWVMALRKERTRHRLTSGPLFWTIIASASLAAICFFYWSQHQNGTHRGTYHPPLYAPGKVIPGSITPREQ